METSEQLKQIVKDKYSQIARKELPVVQESCCSSPTKVDKVYDIMAEDYTQLDGYDANADLGLGCGLPTQFAQIQTGQTVIDLGSGAGNDCFVARHECGPEGKVIGVDFSQDMLALARKNVTIRGFNNVEFRFGDIEHLPVSDEVADVIVSNCVLNLVPNKAGVFAEIYRALKPGGHFSISDIVVNGQLPEGLKAAAEMYAGCVAGAIPEAEYLGYIETLGFEELTLQKKRPIELSDELLARFLSPEEQQTFREGNIGIFSITVFARKPASH